MEITTQALLEGKPTIVKGKEYLSTDKYVSDFLNKMKRFNSKFIINVELPKQMTITDNSTDITFNKVWIQAIIPNKIKNEYNESYGLIYALDIKTPIYKLYRSYINEENNLVLFNKEWIITNKLNPEKELIVDVDNLMTMSSNIDNYISLMKNTFISSEPKVKHELLGGLIEKSMIYVYEDLVGKIKLSPNDIIKSFENIYHNSTSPYYVKDTEECSLYNYYNSICNQITTGKDIINRCEKTILTGMLLNVIN